jgi:hypothetical protein
MKKEKDVIIEKITILVLLGIEIMTWFNMDNARRGF